MPTAKKDKTKPKREPKHQTDVDSEDEDDVEEEEEQVESVHAKKKRDKSRAAFMKLLRQVLAIAPLAMLFVQQPFMVKPRAPGVNRGKVVPLQLSVCGAVQWAKDSPTTLRNPAIARHVNTTARVLLSPYEYVKAYQSKRAMPNEKTIASAYKKSEKALQRAAGDTESKNLASQPMPNFPLIGAYLLTVGSLTMWLFPYAEYLIIAGCTCLVQGCRGLGMEPQPELYVAGVVAVLGLVVYDAAKPKKQEVKRKRK